MDEFAQIAANGIGGRMELLEEPQPICYDAPHCELQSTTDTPITVPKKMDTAAELKEALSAMRQTYAPYLEDVAPKIKNYRKRIAVENFYCDGVPVSVPEYGGPIGNCKKVYKASFTMEALQLGQRAYICFGGADYRAVVLVNQEFVGEHVGFFSPFSFDVTQAVSKGENTLTVKLFNDYVFQGNNHVGEARINGDKLYAATGLGWDDPAEGWHHCPAGMGIYADVFVEIRNDIHIEDVYIRPMTSCAEAWVEVEHTGYEEKNIQFSLSLYGQNFKETVFQNLLITPETIRTVGLGDSLSEAEAKNELGQSFPMLLKHGKNIYKLPFALENPKIWKTDTPYLYQLQVSVLIDGVITDCRAQQFGMRSFTQKPYEGREGMFFLNDEPLRLRGANTMGFEQQDVMRGDLNQLIDDILLAKLCNMNFLRLTQRPVQDEIYTYCDRLGLMTQTDLPLFGCMRRNLFCEGIRQAEEMERIVRKHPCNVLVSYINEPFPNAYNAPHRNLERQEMERFFSCCDMVVKMQNPDRVIKHVDGDYDPPTEGMPDNHCYPMWYNGHGIDIGKLHRGSWMPVKPGWYYGCGEYGAEGLDFAELMQRRYPEEWLSEPFNPRNIVNAQTADFHYFFYDTPDGIEEWVRASQNHQAFATTLMTEAFRRDNRMVSHAIHLFIDAWPSGWMKTIMDCERRPKPAYFAYRNALAPLLLSIRTDRFTYTAGETVSMELFLCNDRASKENYTLVAELINAAGQLIKKASVPVISRPTSSFCAANCDFTAETEQDREAFTLRAVLINEKGEPVTYAEQVITVFAPVKIVENPDVVLIGQLEPGTYLIADEEVTVRACGMLPLHFVSRKTGHPAVAEFEERDFAYWYNAAEDMITPILKTTFTAEGFTPILLSGNMDDNGRWTPAYAAAEKLYEGKRYIICQVDLRCENPVAKRFLRNLYQG